MNSENSKKLEIQLKLMNELEKNSEQSQRTISKELNVALGFANSLIKRLVKKGYLKLSEAPMKRYIYYLTPKGLVEKAKLTSEYIQNSLDFYKKTKEGYEKEFKRLKKKDNINLILAGTGELAEIAILAANIQDIKISYIFDPYSNLTSFCGIEVRKNIEKKEKDHTKNIFFLTESKNPQEVLHNLKKIKNQKIVIPKWLMIR